MRLKQYWNVKFQSEVWLNVTVNVKPRYNSKVPQSKKNKKPHNENEKITQISAQIHKISAQSETMPKSVQCYYFENVY